MPGPSVSVLVVSWQSAAWLERCLTAIDPGEAEIIVAATPRPTAAPPGRAPWRRTRRSSRWSGNLGFAGGVNAARAAARTPRLLLLNPDAAPTPGAIARLADALDQAPDIGAVSGRLVDADGTPQHGFNVRRLPTLTSLAAHLLLIDHLWPDNPASVRYYARDLDPDTRRRRTAGGGLPDDPGRLFDRLGGFDEAFWPAWWRTSISAAGSGRPAIASATSRRVLPASGRRLGRGAGYADVRAGLRRQPPAPRVKHTAARGRGHRGLGIVGATMRSVARAVSGRRRRPRKASVSRPDRG